jgi:type I restriction enzyme S subunit
MSETVKHSTDSKRENTVRLGPRSITIPEEWDAAAFEDAIELNPTYTKPDEGPFDFVPMDAVDEEKQTIEYWTEREKDDCTTTWFKNGDTLYPKITPCTENGKIAFVEGLSTEFGSGSTEFLVFHPREDITDERFVYYLSNLPDFRSVTISLMEGSTGRQRVPSDVFKKGIEVPLPPLPEQRRITDILSTVDEQIQQTDEMIQKTIELKRGLMQDLLTRGIRHDDYEEQYLGPRRLEIPAAWKKARLEEVSEIITRGKQPTYVEEGGVPVLNQSCIYWDGFHPEELKRLDSEVADGWKDKYWVKEGDVLINSTGKGTLGRALEWTKESDTHALDSHITRVHPDKSVASQSPLEFASGALS